jgi:hypothetical protein
VNFEITDEQHAKLKPWVKAHYAKIAAEQKLDPEMAQHIFVSEDGTEYPYFGACGGELSYIFTGTSLGDVLEVFICRGTKWEASINLTDYDSW